MIIAISGRIGSGKDTVGSIIQYLMEYPTSLDKTDHVNRSYNSFVMDIGMGSNPKWKIKKYAAKLKQIASLLTGIPVEDMEKQEVKDKELGMEWAIMGPGWVPSYSNPDNSGLDQPAELEPVTLRWFLQNLGTEAIRNNIHTNAWVNALFADYKPVKKKVRYPEDDTDEYVSELPNWIITDLRFPNEYEAVKQRGGICVRVERDTPCSVCKLTKAERRGAICKEITCPSGRPLHPSEIALDNHNFDFTIENSGTLEDLKVEVRLLVHTLKQMKLI